MLEYLRACHEIDPEWIVWENVPGVLSADGGRAFGSLLAGVAELWPGGGAHGECWTLSTSESHNDAAACSLSSILVTGGVPRRFYLSVKACLGVLRRAAKRRNRFPLALTMALERQSGVLETRA